jgi:plastocyanin
MLSRIRGALLPPAAVILFSAPLFAETTVVQMTSVDFTPRFVPSEITIRPGDTVRWINVDPFLIDHSTCSGMGSADPVAGAVWNSGILRSGEWFEHTFEEAGDFGFFSIPHEFEGMFGTVKVSPSSPVPEPSIETISWGGLKSLFREFLPRD